MKKSLLALIILIPSIMLSMEERPDENKGHIFSKLDPELQVYTIEKGIEVRLNSNPDPMTAVLDALHYLYNATATNKFFLSKRPILKDKLKLLAKEKFSPEYLEEDIDELNKKMDDLVWNLYHITKFTNFPASYLNDIAKLIMAGVNPNIERGYKLAFSKVPILLLELATLAKDINLVRILLAYGANVNLGRPLTFLSDDEVSLKIAKLLIANGVNINKYNNAGDTALMQAVAKNKPKLVQFLVDHGAKVDIKDNQGETALDFARRQNLTDIVDILEKTQAKENLRQN